MLEEGSDAEAALARGHALSFGAELESFVTAGYLDGRVFVLYDDCPCLVYGPLSRNIHAFDERVSLESVQQITGAVPFLPMDVLGSVVGFVDALGSQGLVGLVALGILWWAYNKRA